MTTSIIITFLASFFIPLVCILNSARIVRAIAYARTLVRSYVVRPIDRPIVYPYICPCGSQCPPLTRHAWDKDTGHLLATFPPLDESATPVTSDLDAWHTCYTLHYDSSDDS